MGGGTHIKLGAGRIGLQAGATIQDASDLLAVIAGINRRALLNDGELRDDAIRRVMSPPCATRCYVSHDGSSHDCNCVSGFQWTTDPEAQALEGCPARDVWNDLRSLRLGHYSRGAGPHEPIAADCDCLTPAHLSVLSHVAWDQPTPGYAIAGIQLGAVRDTGKRFAVAITLPPPDPSKERIGHAYGLVNYPPRAPQPLIQMPFDGGPWYVIDASAHWGMARPPNSFYTTGEFVATEILRNGTAVLARK